MFSLPRSTGLILVIAFSSSCAHAPVIFPSGGKYDWSDLCDDEVTCGAQGTDVVTISRTRNIGPINSFLGMMVDPEKLLDPATTCNRPLTEEEWETANHVEKTIHMSRDAKEATTAALKATLESTIKEQIGIESATFTASIDRIVSSLSNDVANLKVATYTIADLNYSSARARCPVDSRSTRFVRSITVVEATGARNSGVETKLTSLISGDAAFSGPLGNAKMSASSLGHEISTKLSSAVFDKFRLIIAVGFGPLPKQVTIDASDDFGKRLRDLEARKPQSGTLAVQRSDNDINSCGPTQGVSGHVFFSPTFAVTPTVVAGITKIDADQASNTRISFKVTNTTTAGFDYELVTWCNTKLYHAIVQWTALP